MNAEDFLKFKSKLKTTNTVVKEMPKGNFDHVEEEKRVPLSSPINVLYITTNWSIYQWLGPKEEIKKILLTSSNNKSEMQKRDVEEYEYIEYFDNYNSPLVEYRAHQLNKKYKFQSIVAISEGDLIRAARLRELFGIKNGQTVESATHYRDKITMKQKLRSKGIEVPVFIKADNATDILNFSEKSSEKSSSNTKNSSNDSFESFVIKPSCGMSSVNTVAIRSVDDLDNFFRSGLLDKITLGMDTLYGLDVERFVHGPMYHIDGMMVNNKTFCMWPSKYMNTCIDFGANKFLASYSLHPSNPLVKRLKEYVSNVILSLPSPHSFPFHAEVWVSPSDEPSKINDSKLVLCEIASRTGGAGVRHVLWELFGIRTDKTWSQIQSGDWITHEQIRKGITLETPTIEGCVGWIIIYPSTGVLLHIPNEEEFKELKHVVSYFPFAKNGEKFLVVGDCVDGLCCLVVSGVDENDIQNNINQTVNWFQEKCVWGEIEKN